MHTVGFHYKVNLKLIYGRVFWYHHHHHHHFPPWIRLLDLFRHRCIAIFSWGVHDLFSLEVCSWGRDRAGIFFAQFCEGASQWTRGTAPSLAKLAGKKVASFHLTSVNMFDVITEGLYICFICCHLLKQPSHLVWILHIWHLKRHSNVRGRERERERG